MNDMSIIGLIVEASVLVQIIMGMLLLASVASWAVILQKWGTLGKAKKTADAFEDQFWSGGDLTKVYRELSSREDLNGLEGLFVAGFREFQRARQASNKDGSVDGIQRAMRAQLTREVDNLEAGLPVLATIGSTSPYIGLFGTVWGIMNSFRALGTAQQATLSMVAPGIAEALIATAMGLFAAIPAVIGYNSFVTRVGRLESRYEAFVEEFTQILGRHLQSDNPESHV